MKNFNLKIKPWDNLNNVKSVCTKYTQAKGEKQLMLSNHSEFLFEHQAKFWEKFN